MSNRRRARQRANETGLSTWTKRRVLSWSLFTLAGVIAINHVLAHGGFKIVPISMGWQDLLLGYPMALIIAIIGGITLDPNPKI